MTDVRASLAIVVKTLLALLATFIATEAARSYLANNATAAALVPAIAAEWVAGRMGVAWSDAHGDPPTFKQILGRIGRGGGLAIGVVVIVCAVATGLGVRVVRAPIAWAELIVSLVVSAFAAVRHELIAHGLLFRALVHVPSRALKVACAAVLSFAFAVGTGVSPREAVMFLPLGACTGLLWMRDRGAFAAVAFHGVWALLWSSVLKGSGFDVRIPEEGLWTGHGSLANGAIAVILLTLTAGGIARFGAWLFPGGFLRNGAPARVD